MRMSTWIPIITLILATLPGAPASALAGGGLPPDFFTLTATESEASDRFGVAVAVDGDTAVVGARDASVGGIANRGAAYVFVRDGGHWVQQARLSDTAGLPSRLGDSVALSGDTALIGTGDSATNTAYVFTRNGSTWSLQAGLTGDGSGPGDVYGTPVALDGDTAVVGAHTTDIDGTFNQGAAYVFARDGGTWVEETRLTASDGAGFSLFGRGVAVAGDMIVVGSPFHDVDGNSSQGAAYVFMRDGGTWVEQARLTASDGTASDNLGEAVAVGADRIVLGAPAAAAVYVFEQVDGDWIQQAKLTPSDGGGGNFGEAVALAGDRIVVGALFADGNQGAAYEFEFEDGAWVEQQKYSPPAGTPNGQFGNAVAMANGALVVGAHATTVDGNANQGAAYVITPGMASPALELDPLVLDFGSVQVGTTSPTMLSMLANVGNVEITGLDFTTPGGDFSADVSVCGTGLVVGQSCPVLVVFEPGQPGPATAMIEITSAETAPLQLELIANGVDAAVPVANITPDAFSFEIHSGSDDSDTLTIGNTGSADLVWQIAQVPESGDCASPDDLPWLAVAPDAGTTPPGGSVAVTVAVNATGLAPGEYSGRLCVTTDDPDATLVEVPVTMTVTQPPVIEMTFLPASLDFGDVETGTVSASLIAILENTGEIDLDGLAFSEPGSGFEADVGRCGTQLPVGEQCAINVTFTPLSAGAAGATLEVSADHGVAAVLALSAAGINVSRPRVVADPAEVSLTLGQDENDTRNLSLGNSGQSALHWELSETGTALRRTGALQTEQGEPALLAAAIDPAGDYGYFTVNNVPGRLVKVDLKTFERVGAVVLNADENLIRSVVIDPAGEYAFVGTGMPPGQVVRIDLKTFERVDRITLSSGEAGLVSAVLDPAGEYAYFATNPSPGRVIKVDVKAFERVGSIPVSGGGFLQSAVIDPGGAFAYFGSGFGQVVKLDLATFEQVDAISLPGGESALSTATIDPTGAFAYFGTALDTRIVKLDLETFQRVASVTLPLPAGSQVSSALVDPAGEYAYFGTGTEPAWLVKIDLESFELAGAIRMPAQERSLSAGVIDPQGEYAWFGTGDSPAYVVETALHVDCALPGWLGLGPTGGVVAPGDDQTVEVTFDTAGLEPGEYEAGLCIASNDPANPLLPVPVVLTVEASGMPGMLVAEPVMLDFGAVGIGESSAMGISVSNAADAGADSLILEPIGLSGDSTFALTGGDCGPGTVLAPQQSCTVMVTFSPLAEQPYSGQIEVVADDGQAMTVDLDGTGIEPPDLPDQVFLDRFETGP